MTEAGGRSNNIPELLCGEHSFKVQEIVLRVKKWSNSWLTLTDIKAIQHSVATARATSVLPVPVRTLSIQINNTKKQIKKCK